MTMMVVSSADGQSEKIHLRFLFLCFSHTHIFDHHQLEAERNHIKPEPIATDLISICLAHHICYITSSELCFVQFWTARYMYTRSTAIRLTSAQQRFMSASICNMSIAIEPTQKALKKPRRSKKKISPIRPVLSHHEKLELLREKLPTSSQPSSSQERISQLVLDQKLRFNKLKKRDDTLLMEEACNVPLSQREFIDRYMSKSTKAQAPTRGRQRALPPPIEYFAIWLETNPTMLVRNAVQRALDDISIRATEPARAILQHSQLYSTLSSFSSYPSEKISLLVKRLNDRRRQVLHDTHFKTLERILQKVCRLATENRLVTQSHIILLHHLQSEISPIVQVPPEAPPRYLSLPGTPTEPSSSPSPRPSRTQRSLCKTPPRPVDILWSKYLRMTPFSTSPLYKIIFHSLVWDRDCILLLVHDIQLPKNLSKDSNNKTFDRTIWNLPPEGVRDLLSITLWKSKRVDEAHVANVALQARLDEREARKDSLLEHGKVRGRRQRPSIGIGEVNWLRFRKDQREMFGRFAGKSME